MKISLLLKWPIIILVTLIIIHSLKDLDITDSKKKTETTNQPLSQDSSPELQTSSKIASQVPKKDNCEGVAALNTQLTSQLVIVTEALEKQRQKTSDLKESLEKNKQENKKLLELVAQLKKQKLDEQVQRQVQQNQFSKELEQALKQKLTLQNQLFSIQENTFSSEGQVANLKGNLDKANEEVIFLRAQKDDLQARFDDFIQQVQQQPNDRTQKDNTENDTVDDTVDNQEIEIEKVDQTVKQNEKAQNISTIQVSDNNNIQDTDPQTKTNQRVVSEHLKNIIDNGRDLLKEWTLGLLEDWTRLPIGVSELRTFYQVQRYESGLILIGKRNIDGAQQITLNLFDMDKENYEVGLGEWKDGDQQGTAIQYSGNGDTYLGKYECNQKSPFSTEFSSSDNTLYIGSQTDDQKGQARVYKDFGETVTLKDLNTGDGLCGN